MRTHMRRGATLALMMGLTSLAAHARASDVVVDEVVRLAKEKALNRDVPDWPVVEREAHALAAASPGEDGRTAAIRRVLASLQDHHSSYRPPMQAAQATPSRSAGPPSSARPPIAVADLQPGRPARLVINAWSGGSEDVVNATQVVRSELNKALSGSKCGLVIDVSANHGGNMWPMMGGIAPLYDDGVLETFESVTGERQVVNVKDGVLRMNESPFPRAELNPVPTLPKRIALIIDSGTASSGEILVLAFKGQKNVRSFGQQTAGASSANKSIRLSNGGFLALTTARILDRTGTAHVGPVLPDVATEQAPHAASEWVAKGCS